MKHDSTHTQRLVHALADGTLSMELRACPRCVDALAELQRLERELTADAEEERRALAEWSAESSEADAAAVRAALERGRRSAGRKWPFRLLLLTLAASLLALLFVRQSSDERPAGVPQEVLLGGDFPLRITLAQGRYDAVEWEMELLPGESFELSFAERVAGSVGETVLVVPGLTGTSFVLTPEVERSLPAQLEAVVVVRDALGLPSARASASAARP